MKEFALACNFEHPVHSLVLDLSDESWKKYFSDQDIAEMMNYNKTLPELPAELNNFIFEARKFPDADSFKQYLKQEFDSNACEWAKDTVLNYIKLFKNQQLPLNHQTEGDMLRRIWFFLDTVLDDSKINCIGNLGRTLAAEEKMERKVAGRKVDLLFTRQRLEYGCCECGRFDDDTKQLYDGSFKMAKVLKDMMYSLYRAAPSSIRQFTLVGYLLYETKFTMVLCDSPAGYVTRITPLSSINLPEEVDDISNQLLTILKSVYQARLIMEESNKLVRKEIADIKKVEPVKDLLLLPCFSVEASKRKRRRSDEEEGTEA
ncbi:hypothetical protein G6F56_001801 [Rhizopus delemar]|nr:hypothetical protein G6F56_001801 [Rhizopus delemar]